MTDLIHDSVSFFLMLAALLLPLLSFVVLLFAGENLKEKPRSVSAIVLMGFSLAAGVVLACSVGLHQQLQWALPWFSYRWADGTLVSHVLRLELTGMSLLMLNVVLFISFLVHLYSYEYMGHRKNHVMYYPYLGLFTFSMAVLVVSHNLLLTFMAWELVGFCSYLLVGFWFDKEAAARAASKAFLINRVADVFFLLALVMAYAHTGSFDLNAIQEVYASGTLSASVTFGTGMLLFIGCMAKTAQFPLNSWLPDAMEGPTPVSALLHAATMVAAGVFLLVKLDFLLTPDVRLFMAYVGAFTAFFGALPALFSFNSKKILAYSTISQLGYMIAALGCSASAAAFFHLITHAFFKAGLFLSVGAVIHALHQVHHKLSQEHRFVHLEPLDLRYMGGLGRKMPFTFAAYLITAASLIGLPFFSGFLSKESILQAFLVFAEQHGHWTWLVPALGAGTVMVTAFYIVRQGLWMFAGKSRLEEVQHYSREVWSKFSVNQPVILVPLVLLSALSFFFVFSFHPFSAAHSWVFSLSGLSAMPQEHSAFLLVLSLALIGGGGALAFARVPRSISVHAVLREHLISRFYYIDGFIARFIVSPWYRTSRLAASADDKLLDGCVHGIVYVGVVKAHVLAWFDRTVVDGFIALLVYSTGKFGKAFRVIQKGNVQNYLFWVLTVLLLVTVFWLIKAYWG